MRLVHPGMLLFLCAIPFLAGFFILNARRARAKTDRFVHHELMTRLTPSVSVGRVRAKRAMVLAALVLLVVAAARPQYGTRIQFVEKKGINVAIVLDTSESMLANDARPTRFQAAAHAIAHLVRKLSGDRVSLVGFAGDAFIQSPLTADYDGFCVLLDALHVGAIPLPGTNLEAAVDKALQTLQKGEGEKKGAIIILTDGENHTGDLDAAIRRVRENGSVVYTLGLGSEAGSPIPVGGAYKKDRDGNVVVTKLDWSVLDRLANETGGKYFLLGPNETEVDELLNELGKLDKSELLSEKVEAYAERFQVFLALAFLLLGVEAVLGVRR